MTVRKVISYLTVFFFVLATPNIKASVDQPVRKLQFAWGAGLNGSVDMSQHGMSTIGINAKVGMRWSWVRFFGIGAEGDILVSKSGNIYPLFLNFQTDFCRSRQLLFMDVRGGVALNYTHGEEHDTNAYASAGVGVTLAKGKTFNSHLILAYTYIGQDVCYQGVYARKCPGISLATLRLGVVF
ncbi:MAG: hypothetical protein J1F20_07035 [Muribaculaceae bacterium]|nr:hypothetical protein [Muribaculaceae bacterium]